MSFVAFRMKNPKEDSFHDRAISTELYAAVFTADGTLGMVGGARNITQLRRHRVLPERSISASRFTSRNKKLFCNRSRTSPRERSLA